MKLGSGATWVVSIAAIGIAGSLTACPSAPATPVNPADEDVAVPLAAGDAPIFIDTSTLKGPLHGAVASIAGVAYSPGWYDLVLGGAGAPEERTVRLQSKGRLPFTVGDVVDVTFAKRMTGFAAWSLDVEVRDGGGKLWAAVYTSMGDHEAWHLEELPAGDGVPCRVALTRTVGTVRHRAIVPDGDARKFDEADGTWAALTSCPGPYPGPPGGPPIPDWSPNPTTVQLSRLR
ncbi:MAG TPA: hypothetical protein VHV30_10030 [Polyangiaceae bacterium]|nr:hypothetical protein [Polyangiaceae bacterium]